MSNEDFFGQSTPSEPAQHCMIDIETLSTRPNAAVLSIGAVLFDFKNLTIGDLFIQSIDMEQAVGHVDLGTVKWWMKQSDDARRDASSGKFSPTQVLTALAEWIEAEMVEKKSRCMWGNGASFDLVILESQYRAVGIDTPWDFWGHRCYRTIKSLYPNVEADPRRGTHHNALDDAIFQVEHLFKIRRTLRGN